MVIPILPENAPFSPAQRAWLNGFFAGLLNIEADGDLVGTAIANGLPNGETNGSAAHTPAVAESFPWHDPALPMADRLKLAEGKPRERVLMAAMAQLDCGACGYLCQTYAEAITRGDEKDLTKCSPGGRETSRKLKELIALPLAPVAGAAPPVVVVRGVTTDRPAGHRAEPLYNRKNPFPAPVLEVSPLTKPGSEKDVRFVSFDLTGGPTYEVGDALGVFPENNPDLVELILTWLGATGDEPVEAPDGRSVSAREALVKDCTVTKCNEAVAGLLANHATDPLQSSGLRALADDDAEGFLEAHDLLDVLERYPSARPPVAELVPVLAPLQPRLYSISSSLKAHPGQVHLTVGVVRYTKLDRLRKGVASTFLADQVRRGQRVRVFAQPAHGFGLPPGGDTPIIMVGPGTGIAPFRAFLWERRAVGAKGKNWLFFGDQRKATDFLFQDEMEDHQRAGVLTRLDTAFSRDQAQKVYVQHRMIEQGADVWAWLEEGGHFYVCGDAKRMALDVDQALQTIIMRHGNRSAEAAREYVKELAKAKRYQRDVY